MVSRLIRAAIRGGVAVAVLAAAGLSCRPSQQPPTAAGTSTTAPAAADTLRSRCTAAWAEKLLGDDYARYEKCSPADKRKNSFSFVFQRIDMASRDQRISGNQCLDLLGQPDRWVQAVTGEIVLVYFYSWNRRQMAAIITLGPDGYIKNCGINAAEANDYSSFNKK